MSQPEQPPNGFSKIVVHHPYRCSSIYLLDGYPWERIQAFYQKRLNEGLPWEPLFDLVKAITASPYAPLLHAITSHTSLKIHAYSPFVLNYEMVKIEYLDDRQFLFTYHENPWGSGIQPPWRKVCSSNESKDVFERLIIHKLRWVSQEFRRSQAKNYEQAGFSHALPLSSLTNCE
jgi:hypothetical protein